MDDLQFRREILADPKSRSDEMQQAIDSDPAKQKLAQDIDILDDKIALALNIPVPDDLCNKLILKQTLASHQQQKSKTRVRLAMAASVAFVLGLTFNFMMYSNTYKNLGDYAIAHVDHEAWYFSNTDQPDVTLASLNEKMSAFNASFDSTFGTLMFADYCRFDGGKALHLVFQGESNPVNVFVVPNDDEITFKANFENEQLHGRSLNFNSSNVIVVGDKKESLNQWQDRLNKNITWSI